MEISFSSQSASRKVQIVNSSFLKIYSLKRSPKEIWSADSSKIPNKISISSVPEEDLNVEELHLQKITPSDLRMKRIETIEKPYFIFKEGDDLYFTDEIGTDVEFCSSWLISRITTMAWELSDVKISNYSAIDHLCCYCKNLSPLDCKKVKDRDLDKLHIHPESKDFSYPNAYLTIMHSKCIENYPYIRRGFEYTENPLASKTADNDKLVVICCDNCTE